MKYFVIQIVALAWLVQPTLFADKSELISDFKKIKNIEKDLKSNKVFLVLEANQLKEARAHFKRHHFDRALVKSREALEMPGKYGLLEERKELFFMEAIALYELGFHEHAQPRLERVSNQKSQYSLRATHALLQILALKSDLRSFENKYSQAEKELLSKYPDIAYARAFIHYRKGRKENGLAQLRRISRNNPSYDKARFMLANDKLRSGDIKRSVALFQEILNPKGGVKNYSEVHHNTRMALVHVFREQGDYARAMRVVDDAIGRWPYDADAYFQKADLALRMGDQFQVNGRWDKKLTDPYAYFSTNEAFYQAGLEAIKYAEELEPNSETVPYLILKSHLLFRKGKTDEAKLVASQARNLRNDPNALYSPLKKEHLKKLARLAGRKLSINQILLTEREKLSLLSIGLPEEKIVLDFLFDLSRRFALSKKEYLDKALDDSVQEFDKGGQVDLRIFLPKLPDHKFIGAEWMTEGRKFHLSANEIQSNGGVISIRPSAGFQNIGIYLKFVETTSSVFGGTKAYIQKLFLPLKVEVRNTHYVRQNIRVVDKGYIFDPKTRLGAEVWQTHKNVRNKYSGKEKENMRLLFAARARTQLAFDNGIRNQSELVKVYSSLEGQVEVARLLFNDVGYWGDSYIGESLILRVELMEAFRLRRIRFLKQKRIVVQVLDDLSQKMARLEMPSESLVSQGGPLLANLYTGQLLFLETHFPIYAAEKKLRQVRYLRQSKTQSLTLPEAPDEKLP